MESIRIKNIKSFEDSGELEIKPITVFVGRNSCGKSSLIRFPVVLAQTAEADSTGPLKFYGKMVDYGRFEDVLHHGCTDNTISFDLKYKLDINIQPFLRSSRNIEYVIRRYVDNKPANSETADIRDVLLRVTIAKNEKHLITESVKLFIDDKCVYSIYRKGARQYTFCTDYKYNAGEFIERKACLDLDYVDYAKFIPCYSESEAIKKIYKKIVGEDLNEDQNNSFLDYLDNHQNKEAVSAIEIEAADLLEQLMYYGELTGNVYERYRDEALEIRYIGPFRADPARIYRDSEYYSHDVGVHGENTSNMLIQSSKRRSQKYLINDISEWTKRVLGCEIGLKEVTGGMFQVVVRDASGTETNLIDNGYGISQVLPIVTEVIRLGIAKPRTRIKRRIPDLMLVLEQPELHLHPAAQSELADLFVDCVLTGQGKKKVIIETHSEHLIRKLQVLIASKDNALTKDMVRVYYVDKDDSGDAFVNEMKILDNGKFESAWPSGFFDKGYLLSRELAKAGIRD